MEEINRQKTELRKCILKERNALSVSQRQEWDRQIFKHLVRYDQKNPCSAYLCYVSYRSEVSTEEFILWCLDRKKPVFVPKVLADRESFIDEERRFPEKTERKPSAMEFYQITAWEELRAGYQGILEPEALPERAFPRWLTETERDRQISSAGSFFGRMAEAGEKKTQVIRILLPGAVFDRDGNRIGYGGGFYDRWLAKWNHSGSADTAVLEKIGLAYGMQIVGTLPAESFDQKADYVITEKSGCISEKTGDIGSIKQPG